MALTVREHMCLDLEAAHWKWPGAKEAAVLDLVGMTMPRFGQVVGSLLDREDALAERPAQVHRLRRVRDQRRSARAARAS